MQLQLCGACRRQLDVAGHAPGSTVRCACGEPVVVAFPPRLPVTGLVCGHCGAPVGRHEERCAHCNAGLSERDRVASLVCPECLERVPEGSRHCSGCGIALRPQATFALRDGAACPACRGPLQGRRVASEGADGSELALVECAACHGLWVDGASLALLTARAARPDRAALGLVPDRADRQRETPRGYVPCVTCGELMQRRQFRHRERASGIVVDQCKDHGVWFDPGELGAALRFVAGQSEGASLAPVRPAPRAPVARRRQPREAARRGWWDRLELDGLLEVFVDWDLFDFD